MQHICLDHETHLQYFLAESLDILESPSIFERLNYRVFLYKFCLRTLQDLLTSNGEAEQICGGSVQPRCSTREAGIVTTGERSCWTAGPGIWTFQETLRPGDHALVAVDQGTVISLVVRGEQCEIHLHRPTFLPPALRSCRFGR